MHNAAAPDRRALWLPLLQRLTGASAAWVVWKNVESALTGIGDIDAAAPDGDWPVIERVFREWAAERDLGPVIVCRHIPGGLNLLAVPPHMSTLLEMGVKARRVWRGSTLFVLDDLLPLMELDARGFRRIRPGAEGLFKLLLNGVRWDGRPDQEALKSKNVAALLRADPEGVRQAAALLGPAAAAAVAGARQVAAGGWNRPAMLLVQSWALARGLREPSVMVRRARFRLRAADLCPVVHAILRDQRRIPADRAGWLDRVAADHVIHASTSRVSPS